MNIKRITLVNHIQFSLLNYILVLYLIKDIITKHYM